MEFHGRLTIDRLKTSWEYEFCSTFSHVVCKAFRSNKGLAAIFGPQSGTTSSHIQSICDTLEIPHIETRWDYRLIRDDYSVNLYPHPRALGQVFIMLKRTDKLIKILKQIL